MRYVPDYIMETEAIEENVSVTEVEETDQENLEPWSEQQEATVTKGLEPIASLTEKVETVLKTSNLLASHFR